MSCMLSDFYFLVQEPFDGAFLFGFPFLFLRLSLFLCLREVRLLVRFNGFRTHRRITTSAYWSKVANIVGTAFRKCPVVTYFKICNVNASLAHIALAFSIQHTNVLSPNSILRALRNLSTNTFLLVSPRKIDGQRAYLSRATHDCINAFPF